MRCWNAVDSIKALVAVRNHRCQRVDLAGLMNWPGHRLGDNLGEGVEHGLTRELWPAKPSGMNGDGWEVCHPVDRDSDQLLRALSKAVHNA